MWGKEENDRISTATTQRPAANLQANMMAQRPPKDVSPIEGAFHRLQLAAHEHGQLVRDLTDRLRPVTRGNSGLNETVGPQETSGIPVADAVSAVAAEIEEMSQKLRLVLQNLAL